LYKYKAREEEKVGEEEEEELKEKELKHEGVNRLIPMANGRFASGGGNKCLNIWSPSFSSSFNLKICVLL